MQRTLALPKLSVTLDPYTAHLFAAACVQLSSAEVAQMRSAIHQHVAKLHAALHEHEFLDIATAQRIAEVLDLLLGEYHTFPAEHQRLIAGAAAYFVNNDDAEPDTASLLGFDDDRDVVNHVLTTIGYHDLHIQR